MTDKKTKVKTLFTIAVLVIAIGLSVIALTKVVPILRLKIADGGVICDGVLTSIDEDLHITDVPEGEIRYLINKSIIFDGPYSQGDVMLENPEACEYDLQFVIYNTQGEMIYTSPLIKPGRCLEKDKLTAVVRSGEYNCSYSALAYKNGTFSGEVNGVLKVTVR